MTIDARKTSASDWRYVSEGGATIVFSYVGAANDKFSGMVLRLRKTSLSDLTDIAPSANASEDDEYEAEADDPTIAFQIRITARLIPLKHLPRLLPCRVSYDLLVSLSRSSTLLRSTERTLKDAIDTRRRRAVLATDLVGFEISQDLDGVGPRSFAVEIKPKWAFLPNPKYLSLETRQVKTRYNRFVMHSYYRTLSTNGTDPDAMSTYDPLDLFSEDEKRIGVAVRSLWDSWIGSDGRANNLKVFVGGKTVSPAPAIAVSIPLSNWMWHIPHPYI